MTKSAIRSAAGLAALAALALLHGAPAVAAPKVWVAKGGADSGACGAVTSPCATFQQAHANVAAGGEIAVLTPGDYGGSPAAGTVNILITKSVSITNDGAGEAGIINIDPTAGAIAIVAGVGDVVGLRGLVLDGGGSGGFGLSGFAGAIHVQNCVIRNFRGSADPTSTWAINVSPSRLFVSDSLVSNNGTGVDGGGIVLFTDPAHIAGVLDRVQIENNVTGLRVSSSLDIDPHPGDAHVAVRDSTIAGNTGEGIVVENIAGQGEFVLVERTTVVNNGSNGIRVNGAHALVLLSDSTITNNGAGVSLSFGGHLFSFGNNRNNNNVGPEGAATATLSVF